MYVYIYIYDYMYICVLYVYIYIYIHIYVYTLTPGGTQTSKVRTSGARETSEVDFGRGSGQFSGRHSILKNTINIMVGSYSIT